MARRVIDTTLDTRTARSRLQARGKPYWRQLEPGLAIGYRKPASGAGKWVVRHHLGGRNDYQTDTFGVADDLSDPDGEAILSFWQAQTRARERMVARAHIEKETQRSLTVATCIDQYIEFLDAHRKSGREARYAANAFIRPVLGKTKIEDLTTAQLRKWHTDLTKEGARVRTGKDNPQRFKDNLADPERLRRRKSTANRILTILKGALNQAFEAGQVASDTAWRRVKPFKAVDSARIRYLSIDEATRFLNAADEDFRSLARGALESGARYGELCDLLVADFNADSGTLAIPDPKTSKPRHIVLSNDGVEFFEEITAGRGGKEPIFLKSDGSQWLADHQADPIRETNKRAKITPPINFHGLRHTWASHSVMKGMPLLVVAKNLGHSTTRMVEKHYGHMAPSYISQAVRAHAPRFGSLKDVRVKRLRRKELA
ncbi:site-specific integrase [Bradyrhizobium sp. JYMT SZCCT0428]|uniref:tyrosine-type recombinase/integrase n=1 Tax=Bradyrhizobium sp. JYMT SZCCT0428 TaxID=2807673 RepID=UPI001BABFB43|nr:site-specific integrase [Bradyrhizobium sp. JYMT SZCCT0428]MBR1154593.1 site-specific integrase [Bradyrhizobium sp. JYMT SZCCT0428]